MSRSAQESLGSEYNPQAATLIGEEKGLNSHHAMFGQHSQRSQQIIGTHAIWLCPGLPSLQNPSVVIADHSSPIIMHVGDSNNIIAGGVPVRMSVSSENPVIGGRRKTSSFHHLGFYACGN